MRSASENVFRRQRPITTSCRSARVLVPAWAVCIFYLLCISLYAEQDAPPLQAPADFSLDSRGRIYVADPISRGGIFRFDDISGRNPVELGITCGDLRSVSDPAECELADPHSIFVDQNDRIIVADATGRIVVMDQQKRSWTSIPSNGNVPAGISFDAKGQLVASYDDNHVKTNFQCESIGKFSSPRGVFVDSLGQVYIADSGSDQILRINPQCNIERFGQTGSGEKQLREPQAVFVDAQKRIYIADTGNHRIARIDDFSGSGWVTFGKPGSAGFSFPTKVAVDTQGRIDVLDSGNGRIVHIDAASNIWTVLPLRRRDREFSSPVDVSVDSSGKIYVADNADRRIVRVNDIAGAGWIDWNGAEQEKLLQPVSVFAQDNRNVYVTDSELRQIIELDPALHKIRSVSTQNFFVRPDALFVDQRGRIFLTDIYDHAVGRLDDPADPEKREIYWGKLERSFDPPSGIFVDSTGRIYVADTLNRRIVRMDNLQGKNWTELQFPQSGKKSVFPIDLSLDSRGRLLVLDSNGRIIRLNNLSLQGWMEFGTEGFGAKQFYHPSAIFLDSRDRVFIADTGNRRIARLDDLTGKGWITLGATSLPQIQLFLPD